MSKFSGARKFKSQWTTSIDGTRHPSKGEAKWWNKLKLKERARMIFALEQNARWDAYIAPDCEHCRKHGVYIGHVKADAAFDDEAGVRHFVDYKGGEGETDISKFKRKFVLARFGVTIELVGPHAEQAAREKAKKAFAKKALADARKT